MTCIVGIAEKGRVWLGADSYVGHGELCHQLVEPKVFTSAVGSGCSTPVIGFGFCGSWRVAQIVEHLVALPAPDADEAPMRYLLRVADVIRDGLGERGARSSPGEGLQHMGDGSNSALIAWAGRLYRMCPTFSIYECGRGYGAVGAGDAVALGALAALHRRPPKGRIERALTITARHSPYVRKPWHIVEVPAQGGS